MVLNKADLVSADKLGELKQEINMWGYQLVAVSARSGLGVKDLLESLAGKVSVVAGKSSFFDIMFKFSPLHVISSS